MVNILGINLSALNQVATLKKVQEFLNDGRQHYLVTPNPEIILQAHQDEELFYILNQADLTLADGFGIKLAGIITGHNIPRLTGADLTLDLLELAREKKLKVAVLNWEEGLSKNTEITEALAKKYPGLEILALDYTRDRAPSRELLEKINAFQSTLFFNTFGAPAQEKFIYHNLEKMPSVKIAIGVGGAFDFITGKTRRAPKIMRQIGLEWLWRLIRQPQRVKRIYNAIFVFSWVLLRSKLNHFSYRQNVACFLYKNTPEGRKVLIVERKDDPNHWQLPQGGTDGESLEKAGAREMREELNTDKFLMKATFKNVHRYLFPPVSEQSPLSLSRRFIFDYKGQSQGLFIAEFIGRDEDIKVNFWDHSAWRWVDIDNLVASIHPRRREAAQIFLDKLQTLNNKK
jgi:N-acetylglucosaminyldiphosphoundecaprenol N-acetyl-beta-D-mannosaminyltransferase